MDFLLATKPNAAEEVYGKISSIAYPVFLITTLVSQSILIITAIFFSPKPIRLLRFLLMKTSFLQVFVSLVLFYVQPRLVAGKSEHVPVYCYGICRHFNKTLCFALYMFWQTFSLGVAVSLTFTLYFKYRRLTSNVSFTRRRLVVSLLLAYIPFYISMICAVVITFRNTLPAVKAPGKENKEVQNLESAEYELIGIMPLEQLPNRINFLMLALGIYVAPVIALWFRWKSYIAISQKAMGPVLREHTKAVMKGLTLQVISHFIFYIPMFSLYTYCILSNTEVYFQQFFLTLSPNLTSTVDPLINLYYVVPYRNQISKLFCCKKTRVTPVVRISMTSTR